MPIIKLQKKWSRVKSEYCNFLSAIFSLKNLYAYHCIPTALSSIHIFECVEVCQRSRRERRCLFCGALILFIDYFLFPSDSGSFTDNTNTEHLCPVSSTVVFCLFPLMTNLIFLCFVLSTLFLPLLIWAVKFSTVLLRDVLYTHENLGNGNSF